MFKILRKISTKETIEAIHNEFNSAGDRLLAEAKEIIENSSQYNSAKAESLQKVGFSSTKEVEAVQAVLNVKKVNEKLAEALQYFNIHFPQYKFITKEAAMQICEKYNLVLGSVKQYTGFVPQKNLAAIEKFFEVENELTVEYIERGSWMFARERKISKADYDSWQKLRMDLVRTGSIPTSEIRQWKRNTSLSIAAPLKDMKTEGYTLKDRLFSKEIPDPVVLAPAIHENGTELFCIITAWGEEASDPIVVNEQSN